MSERLWVDKQIDFARSILEHNQGVISLVDTKAGIVLAVDGAILALLAGTSVQVTGILGHLALVLTVVAIGISAVCGFLTIVPRTVTATPSTHIFFGSITSKSREQYRDSFATSPQEILQDLLDNVYALASIQKKKLAYLAVSLYCLILGLIPLSVLVISNHI